MQHCFNPLLCPYEHYLKHFKIFQNKHIFIPCFREKFSYIWWLCMFQFKYIIRISKHPYLFLICVCRMKIWSALSKEELKWGTAIKFTSMQFYSCFSVKAVHQMILMMVTVYTCTPRIFFLWVCLSSVLLGSFIQSWNPLIMFMVKVMATLREEWNLEWEHLIWWV